MKSQYQWPASRLSFDQIRRLTVLSNASGRPINQLVADAVDQLLQRQRRADAAAARASSTTDSD